MNAFRFRFGIIQCVLALLLLFGAPNPGIELHGPPAISNGIGSGPVVVAAQRPEAVYKRETAGSVGIVKRSEDPGPKAVRVSSPVEPLALSFTPARPLPPPAAHVERLRVPAAPPTGPPFA